MTVVIVMLWETPLDHFLARRPDLMESLGDQFAEGVLFLHEENIAHLDLKPENVVIGSSGLQVEQHSNSQMLSRTELDYQ